MYIMNEQLFWYIVNNQLKWATEFQHQQALQKRIRFIQMKKYNSRGRKTDEEITNMLQHDTILNKMLYQF